MIITLEPLSKEIIVAASTRVEEYSDTMKTGLIDSTMWSKFVPVGRRGAFDFYILY